MAKKSVLIFSGYNPRAIVSFCRYAVENMIPFNIVADSHSDIILNTAYKAQVIAIRRDNNLDIIIIEKFIDLIRQQEKAEEVFILPSTEYLNRILLKNKERLAKIKVNFGLCDESLYQLISDKNSFCDLCKRNGINIPESLQEPPSNERFVIKPKTYVAGDGEIFKPILINSIEDSIKYQELIQHPDTFLQEFIGGKSYYLLYYISKNDKDHSIYSQQNLLQQYNGRSIVLARSTSVHIEKIGEKFMNLLNDLGFTGLVMVEVKKFKGRYYMIEANPRLWGPSQLILDAGMDLFDKFAFENGLINEKPKRFYNKNIWYYWSGGIVEDEKNSYDISRHEFEEIDFLENLANFQINDIYAQDDTFELFRYESKKLRIDA